MQSKTTAARSGFASRLSFWLDGRSELLTSWLGVPMRRHAAVAIAACALFTGVAFVLPSSAEGWQVLLLTLAALCARELVVEYKTKGGAL